MSPNGSIETHEFTDGADQPRSFFSSGSDLRLHFFTGPDSTLTIDDLAVYQTAVADYDTLGSLAPSLSNAAANQGIVFGALPDTWFGSPQHTRLYAHHAGLLVWTLDFPDDVNDPTRSQQEVESQISYAVANNMTIRGHSLIWPAATPSEISNGSFTRDELIDIMRNYIQNTILAYPEVDEWVVVNEPLNFGGTLHDSTWRSVIGDDYIKLAFEFANDVADADDVLIINEFQVEIPDKTKSDAYLQLVSDLLADGVPIDAVGIQGHIALGDATIPDYEEMLTTLERFGALGTRIHITEFDVNTVFMTGTDAEKAARQAAIYADIVNACVNSGVCDSVVTWGMVDPFSWLLDPILVPSGGEAPLIFDGEFAPKASFTAMLEAFNNQAPIIDSNTVTVTIDKGDTATAAGTFSDPDDDLMLLTASVGIVTSDGNGAGGWPRPLTAGRWSRQRRLAGR